MSSVQKHIRLATLEDIPVLLKLAENFHRVSPYLGMKFDRSKGRKFFEDTIKSFGLDFVVLVALKDEEVVGFLVGAANQPVFSSARVAMELGWWVEPTHRGTRGSYLLYKAYEDWAKRVGCSHIQGAYLPGISPELDEFYKKRGYHRVESSYLKVLKV